MTKGQQVLLYNTNLEVQLLPLAINMILSEFDIIESVHIFAVIQGILRNW